MMPEPDHRRHAPFWDDRLTANENKTVEMRRNGYLNSEIADELDATNERVARHISKARRLGIAIPEVPKGRPPSGISRDTLHLSMVQLDGSILRIDEIVERLRARGYSTVTSNSTRATRCNLRKAGFIIPRSGRGRRPQEPDQCLT